MFNMNTLFGILIISLLVSHFFFLIVTELMIRKLCKKPALDDGIKRIYRKKIRYAVSKINELDDSDQKRVRKIVLFDRIAIAHIILMAILAIVWNILD